MEAKPKLLVQVRDKLRTKHYSYRRERQYNAWIRRFILHHDKRHPRDMSGREVEQFLTHLAVDRNVAASTQNQALAAILFLYRQVLEIELPWLQNIVRAKRPVRLPVVLAAKDVAAVLDQLDGQFRLIGQLLYGGGLRLMETLRLRIKDIDFDYLQIRVRDGKGKKDRVTVLPEATVNSLRNHLERVRELHEAALRRGYAGVELPSALERKYPSAHKEWSWQHVFPASRPFTRSAIRNVSTSPHSRNKCPESRAPGSAGRFHFATGGAAHAPTLLRHALAGARLRHPYGSGADGTCRCPHDANLYARDEEGRKRRAEPAGLR